MRLSTKKNPKISLGLDTILSYGSMSNEFDKRQPRKELLCHGREEGEDEWHLYTQYVRLMIKVIKLLQRRRMHVRVSNLKCL